MNKILLTFFGICCFFGTFSQNFTGQWKGEFIDKSNSFSSSGSEKCDYVLELEVNGNTAMGSSYTYFTEDGKKFYTICKVEGSIDFKKKFIEIKETVRTKTNIPNNINNCLQVHKLTYFKKGNIETIEGNWIPAPNQRGDCGFGLTSLTRRSLIDAYPNLNNSIVKNSSNKKQETNKSIKKDDNAVTKTDITTNKETASNYNIDKDDKINNKDQKDPLDVAKEKKSMISSKLEQRTNTVIQTIEVENSTVKIDLYDNGEVDGDSISLFYNGKLLLLNKKLSEKAISINLTIEKENSVNELVMYAENLGSIPPNTALMIVTDGSNRYEVRVISDLQKSGVINFIHKKPK